MVASSVPLVAMPRRDALPVRRLARLRSNDRRDFREGFEFEGRWWKPDDVHYVCSVRMHDFDKLPRDVRDRVNREGR